jgi:hypothetical protein
VRLRRQSGSAGRPLNFTVRGTVGEGEVWVWPRRFVSTPREPFVAAAQLPTRNSSGCAAASAVAFCVRGFHGPDLSLDVGAARSRAVRQCQEAQVPSFSGNTSPSNHRSSGP